MCRKWWPAFGGLSTKRRRECPTKIGSLQRTTRRPFGRHHMVATARRGGTWRCCPAAQPELMRTVGAQMPAVCPPFSELPWEFAFEK